MDVNGIVTVFLFDLILIGFNVLFLFFFNGDLMVLNGDLMVI
jgi:hypothetical protein